MKVKKMGLLVIASVFIFSMAVGFSIGRKTTEAQNIIIQFNGSVSQYPIPVKNGFIHIRVTGNVVTLFIEDK